MTRHFLLLAVLFLSCFQANTGHSSVSVEVIQKWAAGEEFRLTKKTRILMLVPWRDEHREVFSPARATAFEEVGFFEGRTISVWVPVFGRFHLGNDLGIGVYRCDYTDSQGDTHRLLLLFEYRISGVLFKERRCLRVHVAQISH